MSSLQLHIACAILLLALSDKVVGQTFHAAGKYPATVLVAFVIVAPFCAISLVVIVAFVIGGGRIARHVVAETSVASFATVVNVERKSLSKNQRVAFLANAVNVEEAW